MIRLIESKGIEASGIAQAGALNVSTKDININTAFNYNRNSNLEPSPSQSLFEQILSKINPERYAKKHRAAAQVKLKEEEDRIAFYRSNFPSFTDAQILLLAKGYENTPEQANNVVQTLKKASAITPPQGEITLSEKAIDQDIVGAKNAYDEEMRDIWAKLIAQEVGSGIPKGTRLKQILSSMDKTEAIEMKTLLSYCLFMQCGPSKEIRPIPILARCEADDTWSYNNRAISNTALDNLEAMGFIKQGKWITTTIPGHSALLFGSYSHKVLIENKNDDELKLELGELILLSPGIELANIVQAKTDTRVFDIMKDTLNLDFTIKEEPFVIYD